MSLATIFLRLEGPMQAWGGQESKFVIRRTSEAPTKSGVTGLLCAALGVDRAQAADDWLPRLATLRMGVRIDRPGVRWWDYHTVGAKMKMRIAEGEKKTKSGAMLTRREYLCDASFLVALQGNEGLLSELQAALKNPKWTLYLGRKCCPPSRPILECNADFQPRNHAQDARTDMLAALAAVPWQRRCAGDGRPESLACLVEWRAAKDDDIAPDSAEVWYDVPLTFDPPAHRPRFVLSETLSVGKGGSVQFAEAPVQRRTPPPPRARADYTNSAYRKARANRLDHDRHLCVFCKSPATTVQHITYRRAGGGESQDDLRALCRLCHDAVTMLEYGHGMGLDRIDPEDSTWREPIIAKRREIIEFRSLETRKRRLAPEEVE